MATIKNLERQLALKNKERNKILNELDAIKEKKELPALKKKYEGKYFKFDNGYSRETRWPLYTYCVEVVGIHEAIIDSFESTPQGYEFKISEKSFFTNFETEICGDEYRSALKHFLNSAQKLSHGKG